MAAYGMTPFEYQGTDSRFNKVFNEAMQSHSIMMIKSLLRTYRGLDDVEVLVDVGGGVGTTLGMITAKHPHIKGINFDLPHVVSDAKPLPGLLLIHLLAEKKSCSLLDLGSGANIWILHDWSDEHCAKLLKNCWKALPEKGKVIVMECILPVVPEPSIATQFIYPLDVCMSVYYVEGKERTEEEFRALAKDAGFSGFNAAHVFLGMSVMEFTK
ncbi:hypothetical protein GW17_00060733 [Ensete ventricosum]|nr:hypothetical protein GW17_00060733 [Ensete ventricosum]RZR82691.1 hypothetical protein BHM03_00009168 [Ensete ventricosum]